MINYYTEQQIDNLIYVQTPKVLLYGLEYKEMMPQAKLLYITLLDKLKLSMIKDWKDDEGRYFVIMSIDYGAEMLGFSHSTFRRCKSELKKFNLVEEKRMGLNKPNRIYLGRLSHTNNDLYNMDESRSVQFEQSEVLNESTHECQIRATNNNKSINIETNNNKENFNCNYKESLTSEIFRELLMEESNKFYTELSIGRWSKKSWNILINKFVDDTISSGRWTNVPEEKIKGYAYKSLERICNNSDYKHDEELNEFRSMKIKVPEESYNWLES
jgi:hypothetical protein